MAIERWGSLSVADHKDVPALVANVLLYDRLVMPMYTESYDRNERDYWVAHDWDPDGQLARRKQLGELVIECAWDKNRRAAYTDRYNAARQLNAEANGEEITRWLLTEDQGYQLPSGVNHADIFVAYNSEQSTQEEIPHRQAGGDALNENSHIGLLIAHELGVPNIANPEVALKEAISLSQELEFRKKRAALYDFQMTCLNRGMSAKAVVDELRDRNRELIDYLEKQQVPVRKKACFMLVQTLVSAIAGVFIDPFVAIGGLITIAQFAAIDANPDVRLPNRLTPVAAFHDIEDKLGLLL